MCTKAEPSSGKGSVQTQFLTSEVLVIEELWSCVTKKNLISSCKCSSFVTGVSALRLSTYLCSRKALYLNNTLGGFWGHWHFFWYIFHRLHLFWPDGCSWVLPVTSGPKLQQWQAQVKVLQSFLHGTKAGVTVYTEQIQLGKSVFHN